LYASFCEEINQRRKAKEKKMTRIDYIELVRDAIATDSVKQFNKQQLYSIQIVTAGLCEMAKRELVYRDKEAAQGIGNTADNSASAK
jgi:hypothetical protein